MPSGGGGLGSGSLDGSSYVETPNATLAGHPGGSDSFVPSGTGGPVVYTESPIARLAGRGGAVDTMASPGSSWTEYPAATLRGQPSVPEGFSPGGQVYTETPAAALLGGPSVRDRQISIETGKMAGLFAPAVDDVYTPAPPGQVYYEIVAAGLAGTAACLVSRHLMADTPGAAIRGRSGGSDVAVYVGSSSASAKGLPGGADAHLSSSAPSTSARGSGGGSDAHVSVTSPAARLAGTAQSGSSPLRAVETPGSRMVGVPAVADTLKTTEAPAARSAGKGAASDAQATTETATASLRGTGGGSSAAVYAQSPAAALRGTAGGTDARQFIEAPSARMAARGGGANAHVASDAPAARLAGTAGTQALASDPSGLIPALRWHVQQVFPGIQVPEGLPMLEIGREIQTPLIAIVARQASVADGPVLEPHETVPIDIVYVMAEIPLTDNPAKVRDDLTPLRRRILADHHMRGRMGPLGAPSCLNVSLVATPYGRINQYQQHFAEAGQRLDVGVLSLEFKVRSD